MSVYGYDQHVRRTLTATLTLTLTHMITAYSVSGNVVYVSAHLSV